MNPQCANSRRYLARAALTSTLLLAVCAKADMIELTNGDHYRGTVISMTQSNVEFLSEIQGRVKLPRDKIAQITLHEVVAKPVVVTKPAVAPATSPAGAALIVSGAPTAAPGSQADAVVQQMRQQGVDPKLIDQVQEQIFGKSSPEAAQKFNELLGGLSSGSISTQDIRKQAQSSIDQIKAAKKEFGPDAGEMLDGYLAILERFVNESASDESAPSAQLRPRARLSTPGANA